MNKLKGLILVPLFIQLTQAQEIAIFDRVSMQPLELAEVTAPEKTVLFSNDKGIFDICICEYFTRRL